MAFCAFKANGELANFILGERVSRIGVSISAINNSRKELSGSGGNGVTLPSKTLKKPLESKVTFD